MRELSFQAWTLGNRLGLSYAWTPPDSPAQVRRLPSLRQPGWPQFLSAEALRVWGPGSQPSSQPSSGEPGTVGMPLVLSPQGGVLQALSSWAPGTRDMATRAPGRRCPCSQAHRGTTPSTWATLSRSEAVRGTGHAETERAPTPSSARGLERDKGGLGRSSLPPRPLLCHPGHCSATSGVGIPGDSSSFRAAPSLMAAIRVPRGTHEAQAGVPGSPAPLEKTG